MRVSLISCWLGSWEYEGRVFSWWDYLASMWGGEGNGCWMKTGWWEMMVAGGWFTITGWGGKWTGACRVIIVWEILAGRCKIVMGWGGGEWLTILCANVVGKLDSAGRFLPFGEIVIVGAVSPSIVDSMVMWILCWDELRLLLLSLPCKDSLYWLTLLTCCMFTTSFGDFGCMSSETVPPISLF